MRRLAHLHRVLSLATGVHDAGYAVFIIAWRHEVNQARTAFGGFVPPKKNYFPMPNEWINICAEIDNLAELKVIQYVLRHTWGYQEFDGTPKHITIDEFMHGRKYSSQSDRKGQRMDNGTGLSNRSVIDGLKRAVDHKYLICEEDRSDKARIVKAYALNMKGAGVKVLHTYSEDVAHQSDVKNVHTYSEEPSQPAMKNVHSCCEESTQRSEKETLERHQKNTKERETPATPTSPAPAQSSLSSSLLESLSDAQADFWRRWCAIAHCGDDALKEQLLPDVAWLAECITTTADLESLYRSNAAMLLELSQAKGTQYTPPHLKNLVKHYPTWASAQDAKQKQREQASKKTVSGTGAVKNWTQARLSGQMDAPPVVYPDVEKPKKPASMTESMGIKKDLAAMLEKMRG